MNPVLISLHQQGVFRQSWSTLTLFTSDFSLSLVDYLPLIPIITVVSVAIHTFRNNYPSAVYNRFICSLLDMEFCAVKKTKTKKKTNKKNKQTNFKIQHEFSDRCSKQGIYTLPSGVVGWGKGVMYLTSPRRPTDICLQMGKACYLCRR